MRFLGLDSSTQSLTALLVDTDTGEVIDRSVAFGERLPQYGSPNGFLAQRRSARQAQRSADVGGGAGAACSASCGQPASMSTRPRRQRRGPAARLGVPRASLDERRAGIAERAARRSGAAAAVAQDGADLDGQLDRRRVRGDPAAAGGADADGRADRLASRSSASPARRSASSGRTIPAGYERDRRDSPGVSSFIASLLAGTSAPIDFGDGAGMNLLELATGTWSPKLLEATAPGLGREAEAGRCRARTYVGTVADYFVEEVRLRAAARRSSPSPATTRPASSAWAPPARHRGRQPGHQRHVFAAMAAPRTDPRGYGNVFGNPAGGFMALCCFANGSLAREEVRARCGLGWDDFARAILEKTQPGNGGNMLLPYFVPEITPRLPAPAPSAGSERRDFVAGRDAGGRGPRRGRGAGAVHAPALGLHRRDDRPACW